jgi:antitoxin component of RelBE/YafQ-DinJ toxin-antitoxin module
MTGSKERSLNVRVDRRLSNGMDEVEARYGTRPSDQVRKALEEWLTKLGVMKADRPRAVTRKRS